MVYPPGGLPLGALIKSEDNHIGKQSKKMPATGTFVFEAIILGLITACSAVNIAKSSRSLQRKECQYHFKADVDSKQTFEKREWRLT